MQKVVASVVSSWTRQLPPPLTLGSGRHSWQSSVSFLIPAWAGESEAMVTIPCGTHSLHQGSRSSSQGETSQLEIPGFPFIHLTLHLVSAWRVDISPHP